VENERVIAPLHEIVAFARERLVEAKEGSRAIVMSEGVANSEWSKFGGLRAAAPSIADLPECDALEHASAFSAWAVVLAVDMRGSSERAIQIGPKNMHITMHTFLPTLAHVVDKAGGKVASFRGDALFAVFGLTTLTGSGTEVTTAVSDAAARGSVNCGKAMIEAVQDAICPILVENGIPGGIEIGVGASVGNVQVTRIGYETANELTVYGPPVNQACKQLSSAGRNEVRVSKGLEQIFPSGKGGRIRFNPFSKWFSVGFPDDYYTLERTGPGKPR
jgi:class 3 adenylate cyclase